MTPFSHLRRRLVSSPIFLLPALLSTAFLASCAGVSSSASPSSTGSDGSTTTNPYAEAYKNVIWAPGVTVTFPSACSMTVTASGEPNFHNAYYLTPAKTTADVVATTPSGIQLAVGPYAGSGLSNFNPISATYNICPTKASSPSTTDMGAIGLITSGEVLFDSYEATDTVALSDDASYTFTTGGTSYTAYFVDQCSSHTTAGMSGSTSGTVTSTWHYHGNPVCWTPIIDGTSGPSHIIGIALDGYPIYGGRDINGNIINPSTLDACNGITSATPEFPSGAYHYVLPINADGTAVATKQSSIGCYTGTASPTLVARMEKFACNMKGVMMAHNMPVQYLPKKREEMEMAKTINPRGIPMPGMPRGM